MRQLIYFYIPYQMGIQQCWFLRSGENLRIGRKSQQQTKLIYGKWCCFWDSHLVHTTGVDS